jgi:hypothetical protein
MKPLLMALILLASTTSLAEQLKVHHFTTVLATSIYAITNGADPIIVEPLSFQSAYVFENLSETKALTISHMELKAKVIGTQAFTFFNTVAFEKFLEVEPNGQIEVPRIITQKLPETELGHDVEVMVIGWEGTADNPGDRIIEVIKISNSALVFKLRRV